MDADSVDSPDSASPTTEERAERELQLRIEGELGGDAAGRLDVELPDREPGVSGRAAQRRLVQVRRRLSMDALPLDSVCGARWAEWQLDCELELTHPGCHVGINEDTGKVGCWGGGTPAYVARVLPEPEADPRAQ